MSTGVIWNGGELRVDRLGRGSVWFDTGTHDSLAEAAGFVRTMEKRWNQRIVVPEEIAFLNGWISREELAALGHGLRKNSYGQCLLSLAGERGRIDLDGALGALTGDPFRCLPSMQRQSQHDRVVRRFIVLRTIPNQTLDFHAHGGADLEPIPEAKITPLIVEEYPDPRRPCP